MTNTLTDTAVKVAIAALDSETATPIEKIEMLLEMATRLQHNPQDEHPLIQAIVLYEHALEVGGATYPLLQARALAGKATALRSLPEEGPDRLLEAKALYEEALPLLRQHGAPEEKAETQMNLGLVMQSLVPYHRGKLADCIRLYQQALEVFTGKAYPQEYAILQNNIAIAYLSMASTAGRDDLKQAIAVQTFEQALTVITLIEHPSEYAMLQNNLGNALQYLPSAHAVDNNLRALTAYDEALKVRTAEDTPLAYAHTIANRANVLVNLPDDLEHPEQGNQRHLQQAVAHYQKAEQLFLAYDQLSQAEAVRQARETLSQAASQTMPEAVS
ncbi:MAG: hypothetical protein F6K42_20990 [Leptolyngbya sp. SIO1D8]|nr:hypothetical protein [Leptolyngbya sp. SIO1D8]